MCFAMQAVMSCILNRMRGLMVIRQQWCFHLSLVFIFNVTLSVSASFGPGEGSDPSLFTDPHYRPNEVTALRKRSAEKRSPLLQALHGRKFLSSAVLAAAASLGAALVVSLLVLCYEVIVNSKRTSGRTLAQWSDVDSCSNSEDQQEPEVGRVEDDSDADDGKDDHLPLQGSSTDTQDGPVLSHRQGADAVIARAPDNPILPPLTRVELGVILYTFVVSIVADMYVPLVILAAQALVALLFVLLLKLHDSITPM